MPSIAAARNCWLRSCPATKPQTSSGRLGRPGGDRPGFRYAVRPGTVRAVREGGARMTSEGYPDRARDGYGEAAQDGRGYGMFEAPPAAPEEFPVFTPG